VLLMNLAADTSQGSDRQFLAELNRSCFCLPLDRTVIDAGITAQSSVSGLPALLSAREHLFAATAVFVCEEDVAAMHAQISAIEAATALGGYRDAVFSRAEPALMTAAPDTNGVLMGYDFHITEAGPRLIEVNTNAGGAFLVEALQTAAGLPDMQSSSRLADMFITEWQTSNSSPAPKTLAIIDETPDQEFLYPDMLLAQELLDAAGIKTLIISPDALAFEGGRLMAGGKTIDMVYNRLTDFQLAAPASKPLRDALIAGAATITPAPRHHALHADKRNLGLLGDLETLRGWGLADHHIKALSDLPRSEAVTPEKADALWARRKKLFFKPACGFGSRATYRGDKLTRRVWAEILEGDYVAQDLVPPTVRGVTRSDGQAELKFDLRVYTYDGRPLLMAARVYQGQTTNFRTSGGGFAPVITHSAPGDCCP